MFRLVVEVSLSLYHSLAFLFRNPLWHKQIILPRGQELHHILRPKSRSASQFWRLAWPTGRFLSDCWGRIRWQWRCDYSFEWKQRRYRSELIFRQRTRRCFDLSCLTTNEEFIKRRLNRDPGFDISHACLSKPEAADTIIGFSKCD